MDVKANDKVQFHTLLDYTLKKVFVGNAAPADIVERVLKAVLPICNQKKTKNLMEAYRKPTSETGRYAPKITAFNHVLKKLKLDTTQPAGCEFKQPTDIVFHRNDAKQMTSHYNDLKTIRKPDIILASEQDILDSQDHQRLDPSRAPRKSFDWHIVRATEVNKFEGPIDKLPSEYSSRLSCHIPAAENVTTTPSTKAELREEESEDEENVGGNEETEEEEEGEGEEVYDEDKEVDEAAEGQGAVGKLVPIPEVPTGSKRVWPEGEFASSKKIKLDELADLPKTFPTTTPITQNALYAAEMLSRGPYALHAYTFLVVDDVVWVWYFDRQNVIQTTGINFIQDLPYFVALLFAFQRFDQEDWGIKYSLQNPDKTNAPFGLAFPEQDIRVSIDPSKKIHSSFCLTGRATQVLVASTQSDKSLGDVKLSDQSLIAKIYWPEEERINEMTAIMRAHAVLRETEPALEKHLPRIVCWIDIDYKTGSIREALGIPPDGQTASRILRILIAMRLERLDGPSLVLKDAKRVFKGWKECFHCHYALWKGGIEHGDISFLNLMWDPVLRVGVLNDFDLVRIEGIESRGTRRTATIAFTSLELLSINSVIDRPKRLYCHDAESLVWALSWVCVCLDVYGDIPPDMTKEWVVSQLLLLQDWKNPTLSWKTRASILTHQGQCKPIKGFEPLWRLAVEFLHWTNKMYHTRALHVHDVAMGRASGNFKEPTPEAIHQEIVEILNAYEKTALGALLLS